MTGTLAGDRAGDHRRAVRARARHHHRSSSTTSLRRAVRRGPHRGDRRPVRQPAGRRSAPSSWSSSRRTSPTSFVTPRVMSDQVDLHPMLVIFSLLVGGTLFGFWGMLFAIPVAATGKALFVYYYERRTQRQLATEDGALFREPAAMRRRRRREPTTSPPDAGWPGATDEAARRSDHVKSAEIRESFLSFFESKGCRGSRQLVAHPRRPVAAAHDRRHGAVQAGLPRREGPRLHARHDRAEVRAHHRHRHHRDDRAPPQLLRDARQLQLRRLLQVRGMRVGYEYSTEVLGLDPDRLWFSIYEDDDEAEAIWRRRGRRPRRAHRAHGREGQLLVAPGPTGPCGPCSELYYDQGPEVGCGSADCAPGCDCDRYLEYWNLVFMQYDRAGGRHARCRCPSRTSTPAWASSASPRILQGVHSNFETDILRAHHRRSPRRSPASTYGAGEQDRHVAAHPRRPRARGDVHDRRRHPALERGPRLRAAPPAAPRGAPRPAARRRGRRSSSRLVDARHRADGRGVPRDRRAPRAHHAASSRARRSASAPRCAQGMRFLETELARARRARATMLDGAHRLHAARHVRLPLRAHRRDRRREGRRRSTWTRSRPRWRRSASARAPHVKDESWNTFGGAFAELAASVGRTEFVGYERDEADATVVGIVVDGAAGRAGSRPGARARSCSTHAVLRRAGRAGRRHRAHRRAERRDASTSTDTKIPSRGVVRARRRARGGRR